ncbi:hypothetical protein [Labrys monachus]|uniref:Transglycosylase SLT domain-containing protein n=1 Tax=Labrys monachus TaxID=217067 RepID=A0ABU0FCZ1_9HYPH|nr:hypothetical protein [Labrys monachus]MDQ0392192.1 hypothetical protein [Labrys monachus]
MPRFPDYVAQNGLDIGRAPQIQAHDEAAQALRKLGQDVGDVADRWLARQKEQADFDDEISYQRYGLAQRQAMAEALAAAPQSMSSFHDSFMAARDQADKAFLQTVNPGNRARYAGLLSLDRDKASIAAAEAEYRGRGAYEADQYGRSAALLADEVRRDPSRAGEALRVLHEQTGNLSSLLTPQRQALWDDSRRQIALADWEGRYGGDDPSDTRLREALAAVGVSSSGGADRASLTPLKADGPVDPAFRVLDEGTRLQLANRALARQRQAQVSARATLAQALQDGSAVLPYEGVWPGEPPGRARFVAAYGPDEGAQRYQAFDGLLRDGPRISALLRQPDDAQDAALIRTADATDAESRRFHGNALAAIARYRSERAADPVGTLGKLYPDFGRQWAALQGADPATLRQSLPGLVDQTAALMDAAGVPPGERRYLPNGMASTIVSSFNDPTRSISDRLNDVSNTLLATRLPTQQHAVFDQLVSTGLPPMMKSVVPALVRGDDNATKRIAEAVLLNPNGDISPGNTISVSLLLGNASDPSYSNEISSVSRDQVENNRNALLYRRLVQNSLARNGGDLDNAEALALSDIGGYRPAASTNVIADGKTKNSSTIFNDTVQKNSLDRPMPSDKNTKIRAKNPSLEEYMRIYIEKNLPYILGLQKISKPNTLDPTTLAFESRNLPGAFVMPDAGDLAKMMSPEPTGFDKFQLSKAAVLNEIRRGAIDTANEIGVAPLDLLTAMYFETAGTLNPWKKGPTTNPGGRHIGLIQWGDAERNKYGITKDMLPYDQVRAVGRFLQDRGVMPGMGLLDIYSAINAGHVGLYNRTDAGNGGAAGTVADKVAGMADHAKKAQALLNKPHTIPPLYPPFTPPDEN